MNKILLAADFAAKAHSGQVRKYTNEPYINHSIAVALKITSYEIRWMYNEALPHNPLLPQNLKFCPKINFRTQK